MRWSGYDTDFSPRQGHAADEIDLRLVRDADGAVLWPVQRVMKRYAEGEENGIAVYAASLAGLDVGASGA